MRYNNKNFYINDIMFKQLGTIIEVKKVDEKQEDGYSYIEVMYGYYYHKLWFEPEFEDFITEEEFMI